uniref:DNA polymerase III subunit alpha n=1 Tax=candidate division WOR-3 bacterium TaxID=2052148 RepID=A0A7C4TFB2_UNCW3
MTSFIHLHNHTEYSLLDGAIPIEKLVEIAAHYKMPALAITDHGNLFGAIEFYKTARNHGIKPIIGMEAYIAPRSRFDQSKDTKIPESSFHLTLLCENEAGYKNLIKLSSLAYLEGFYYKPRIDKEILQKCSKGLIGLSGCYKGEIPYRVALGDLAGAKEALKSYQEILGKENFYLEVMHLGLKNEEKILNELINLSREFDAPIVATNDCHYLTQEDYKAHDVLLCIGTKKILSDKERLRFETKEAYFRPPEEMARIFENLPEAITNSILIGERCNLLIDTSGKDVKLPNFPRPSDFATDFDYLKSLALEGIKEKFGEVNNEIGTRLDYELSVIKKMGLAGYFLIVRDIIQFARSKGIPVGPGRGSAVGSLVLYALGITDVNPLKYNLLFERFLNPERVSLPDVDVDFGDTRRDEVIDFIKKRYGEKNVTQVITFGTMQARAVVRDVGRVLNIPYNEVDKLAKLIPFHSTIDEALNNIKEFKSLIEAKPEYKELIEIAKKLEGLARHPATHAAGVVITPKELTEYVPLFKNPEKGEVCTQFAKNSLEDIGLLKMDILGLRTLTVIDECLRMINKKKEEIPFDDHSTYELLKNGETVGVFQLESQGMQELLKSIKPEKFEDLIAIIALYRPGPMGNIDPKKIVENKDHPEKIEYLHPKLEKILKETYGVILYQEQVMQIAAEIAGFSMAEADNLRRAMAKKIYELMDVTREKFIEGAKKNGIPESLAEKIFKNIAPFAGYGFNKSHATAYAVLAYQTAYLKCHYKLEFILASLNSEINDTDRLAILIKEARRLGIEVLAPDINKSFYYFTKENNAIRYGLGALKNLGRPFVESIVKERTRGEFKSLFDFQIRMKNLNKKGIEALVKSGAFAKFEPNIKKLLDLFLGKETAGKQESLFGTKSESDTKEENEEIGALEKIALEKETFGFYFSGHPLEKYQEEMNILGVTPISRTKEVENGESIVICGILNSKKVRKDKNGRDYAIITIEDFEDKIDVFVFADVYAQFGSFLKKETPIIIKGWVSGEEEKKSFKAGKIIPISMARNYYKKIIISCYREKINEIHLKSLYELIEKNKGECEVWFKVEDENQSRKIRSRSMKVNPQPEVLEKMREILGGNSFKILGGI